jgi:hypothetical protein
MGGPLPRHQRPWEEHLAPARTSIRSRLASMSDSPRLREQMFAVPNPVPNGSRTHELIQTDQNAKVLIRQQLNPSERL